MQGRDEKVTLASLANGAAVEAFDYELERALENILDPNTKPTVVREVTLKVKIKPSEDRALASVEFGASSKMAPVKTLGTRFFIGNREGKPIATEHDTRQMSLPDKETATPVKLGIVNGGDRK